MTLSSLAASLLGLILIAAVAHGGLAPFSRIFSSRFKSPYWLRFPKKQTSFRFQPVWEIAMQLPLTSLLTTATLFSDVNAVWFVIGTVLIFAARQNHLISPPQMKKDIRRYCHECGLDPPEFSSWQQLELKLPREIRQSYEHWSDLHSAASHFLDPYTFLTLLFLIANATVSDPAAPQSLADASFFIRSSQALTLMAATLSAAKAFRTLKESSRSPLFRPKAKAQISPVSARRGRLFLFRFFACFLVWAALLSCDTFLPFILAESSQSFFLGQGSSQLLVLSILIGAFLMRASHTFRNKPQSLKSMSVSSFNRSGLNLNDLEQRLDDIELGLIEKNAVERFVLRLLSRRSMAKDWTTLSTARLLFGLDLLAGATVIILEQLRR